MSTNDDPIFAAIERHRIAREAAEPQLDDAVRDLAGTVPQTIPGIRALLEHVLEFNDMVLYCDVTISVLKSILELPALNQAEVAIQALRELGVNLDFSVEEGEGRSMVRGNPQK